VARTGLFDFTDYKQYLTSRFDSGDSPKRTGQRSAFAKALGCQPAYLSRVLNAEAHLSPEQAEKASAFLGHTAEEERYFFYLVLWGRAGTRSLRAKLAAELEEIKKGHLVLKNRIALRQPLSLDRQVTYYSAWYYTAVHMLLDIQTSWTPALIARALGLSMARVSEILSFLTESGLIEQTPKGYRLLERQTHLDAESGLVSKHHVNWRLRAIQSLEGAHADSLHYSSVVTVARKDVPRIREIMLSAIEEIRKTVRATKAEDTLYSYCLDLFPIGETP
jgi:uncharacterized protein (TIGR02147 family)